VRVSRSPRPPPTSSIPPAPPACPRASWFHTGPLPLSSGVLGRATASLRGTGSSSSLRSASTPAPRRSGRRWPRARRWCCARRR